MKHLTLFEKFDNSDVKYVGADDWGRGLYKADGKTYVDVDGVLHTRSDQGEPLSPAKDLKPTKDYKKTMLQVDLVSKYAESGSDEGYRAKFEEYKPKIKGFTETSGDYNIGDIIEITAGYNNDIRYKVEILGFDGDGDIYLLWDSFWAPIKNDDVRSIKLIKKADEAS